MNDIKSSEWNICSCEYKLLPSLLLISLSLKLEEGRNQLSKL